MLELLRSRRSVRRFTGEPVAPEAVARLEEAMLRCPSSYGRRPWEIVVVDDRETLSRLGRAKPQGSSFVEGAALAVAVLGDPAHGEIWVEDCSIVALVAHLAAHDLGLGSCWVQIRDRPHDGARSAEAYVREVLGAPGHLRVLALVAVGHPAETPPGHPAESLDRSKLHRGRFGRRA